MKKLLFVLVAFLFLLTSCGTSKTVVRVDNRAEGVTTSVSVSGNAAGETSINVSPNLNANLYGKE